jgi:hypothetical protein
MLMNLEQSMYVTARTVFPNLKLLSVAQLSVFVFVFVTRLEKCCPLVTETPWSIDWSFLARIRRIQGRLSARKPAY